MAYASVEGDYDDITNEDVAGDFVTQSPGQCSEAWTLGQVYLLETDMAAVFKAVVTADSICNPTVRFSPLL